MRRMLSVSMGLWIFVFCTSCQTDFVRICSLTWRVHEGNLKYRSYRAEMRPNYPWKRPVSANALKETSGGYTRTIQLGGREYHEFQFRDILIGQDRILEILVDPKNRGLRLREGNLLRKPKALARLIPFNGRSVAKIWHEKKSDFFRKSNAPYPGLIIKLKTDWNKMEAVMILRTPGDGRPRYRYLESRIAPARIDNLEWRERTRIIYALRHAQYIATIPLDLVWLPIAWPFYQIIGRLGTSIRAGH